MHSQSMGSCALLLAFCMRLGGALVPVDIRIARALLCRNSKTPNLAAAQLPGSLASLLNVSLFLKVSDLFHRCLVLIIRCTRHVHLDDQLTTAVHCA